MIIGFCGEKQAGKDTAAAYLIKEYDFERRAFAHSLKQSVAALLRIPFWEVDKHKLDDTVYVTIGYKNTPPRPIHVAKELTDDSPGGVALGIDLANTPSHMWSPISELTFREFLQRYGTESHRDVFGQDFWTDQTLPVGGFYQGRKIVLSDVRFQNEVDRINELGGLVCRIKRPGFVNNDPHSSEATSLLTGISYEIMNDTTIEDFHGVIEEMLEFVGS